jgi:MFS family permease
MNFIKKYPKNLWILAIGMMINITGASFLWPLNTIYMTQQLGQTITTAGMVLMFHAGAGIIGNLLGGTLYDRIGGKWTILLGGLFGTACVFSLAFLNTWPFYVSLMIILGFSNGMVFPAMYAMAGGVWSEGGRKSFNVIYVSQNLGVAIGSALGGLVAQFSFTLVFLVNGLTFLGFIALIWFGVSERLALQPRAEALNDTEAESMDISRRLAKKRFTSLVILSLGFMMSWISYVQWQTSISVYMQDLGFSLASYSLLWTVNGLLILLAQPFSSLITERVLPSVRAQLLTGVVIFVFSLLILSQQQFYTGFIIGMVIMTIGEIFIWPAVPTAAQDLAPAGRSGFYQGVVGSSATAGRMLGPFIGGMLFEVYNPQIMLYGMVLFCGVAFICFSFYDRLSTSKKVTDGFDQVKTPNT